MAKRARASRREEEQEKILLGLKEAPPPRVRIVNMYRVYGAEAMQDPTAIETKVRSEMAERTERHHQRNQARKKNPEEKREKKRRKLIEDTTFGTNVAVYKVLELSIINRYKLERNAQQSYLTGCCIIGPSFTLVVIEGGPKGLSRYKKLMLRRLKWNVEEEEPLPVSTEDKPSSDPTVTLPPVPIVLPEPEKKKNRCDLIWEGEVLQAAFNDFQIKNFRTELLIRKYLTDRGCVHYWDVAKNFVPPLV